MGNARCFQQRRRRYFNTCVAVAALTFLITSACAAQSPAADQSETPLNQELKTNPELVTEFGQLLEKLQQGIQPPPGRSASHLLPLLPESTVFYIALPNYGDVAHQALAIFQQEVQQSSVLRAWWQGGGLAANGPKIEDALEKVYQLSQFLGDEIVVSVATKGRQGPSLLILAEVRKPGLKDFLQEMVKYGGDQSKPSFRVFDVQELAATKNTGPPQEPVILVRPDLLVATLDFAQLRILNAYLDGSKHEFSSSPFGQRVAQVYEGGASMVGAIDFQKVLKQVPPGMGMSQVVFERSGFADMKYLVWDHKTVMGRTASEMELSFTSPRHGAASWLGVPRPMGSLDFVSPKAIVAIAALLKNPAQIFDELKDLSTASNPKAFASVTQMETALKLSFKEDLFSRLGGEIAVEVDSLKQPDPVWKVILQVNDPKDLQSTLSRLLASAPVKAQQSEEGGVTYHTLRMPSKNKALEVGYAFVDSYLVVASSKETVMEAIRLHRSGESLAKSAKFLASLPPGHGSDFSGLLYENPAAVTALSLRQVLPEMAESIVQANAETPPVVICAYGEESALREVGAGQGVDAGMILVGAAIAIPNLLRARIAANESSAIAIIRTANTAQVTYSVSYPQRGFAPDLATLGPDPRAYGTSSADHANLIDATLGTATCTAGTWCTASGFQFSISAACKKQRCNEYVVVGTPVTSATGSRSFCSTSDGVVRFKISPPLALPVSVSECQSWSPLR
jgi:uncharacterized protein DUF3352